MYLLDKHVVIHIPLYATCIVIQICIILHICLCLFIPGICTDGFNTLIVDSTIQPEGFGFSVDEGIVNSVNNDQIESDVTSYNANIVTVSFDNLNPQDNIIIFMYFKGTIDSKDDEQIEFEVAFNTDTGTFTTAVSYLFSDKKNHKN